MVNRPETTWSSQRPTPPHLETESLFLRVAPNITSTSAAIIRAALICDRLLTQCSIFGAPEFSAIALELREQIDVVFAFNLGETSKPVFASEVPVAAPK
jgi:hypothetical protein